MSTTSTPIPPELFSLALRDLPLDSVYAKASELLNSAAHLRASNTELASYAAAGDRDCAEALAENALVLERFEERVRLCREEVESRGLRWSAHGAGEEEAVAKQDEGEGGEEEVTSMVGLTNGLTNGEGARGGSGRLTDEELRRRLEAQMAAEDDGEEGVHL